MFQGNAPLHTSCKFLLGRPWLMPLCHPFSSESSPSAAHSPQPLSPSYSVIFSTVAGVSQPSLAAALPLSLIAESSPARLGPLGRSNVPRGHIDRCAEERLLHRLLLFLLLWFHLIQSNVPSSRNAPVPNSALGALSRAGAGAGQ